MANQFSLNDYLVIDTTGRVGIGHTNPTARLYVTGSGATSSTVNSHMLNSAGSTLLYVRDDGNVGVGTSSPSFKLDVTGSSRVIGTSYVTGSVAVTGSLDVVGDITATTKSFLINHPNKAGWMLRHGSLEGPENGVYVRGNVTATSFRSSPAYVQFPEYWCGLIDENSISVHVTPIGKFNRLYAHEVSVRGFAVSCDDSSAGGTFTFSYVAYASRVDNTFVVEYEGK